MKVSPLKIGNSEVRNNIFLAPMAGYTDGALRSLFLKLGAGLCFTELVSAKGLVYGGKGSEELLRCEGNDVSRTAAQIFGGDPYFMRKAAESESLKDFSVIDINMGCPVPKVYKNGEGSALLADINKAKNIIKECAASGKTITVKIRTGLKYGDDIAAEFAKMAEDAGASLVTVHGRVREAYYSGEPDYAAVERAVAAVKIPVIANGGIFTVSDADKMLDRTGAAGIMLARGALRNPFLFSELLNTEPSMSFSEFAINQLKLSVAEKGEIRAVKEFRKFAPYYFRGAKNSGAARLAVSSAATLLEIERIIRENL